MAKAIKDLSVDEKKIHYLEYTEISNQLYEAFTYSLSEIKKSVNPSKTIKIIFPGLVPAL